MYLKIWTLFCILALFTLFKETEAWSGNVCTRQRVRYWSYRYCSCRIWFWCVHYRRVTRAHYDSEQYCCPGWTHTGNEVCNKPICSPACQNGGTCIRPFTCQCRAGFEGDICGGIAACSHLSPCYPGRCYLNSGKSECMCSDNFGGSTCLNLIGENQKPEIQMVNATFAYYSYTKKEYAYDFMTDATEKTDIDFVWVNQEEFNHIKFDIDASVDTEYNFQSIQSQPDYIRGFKFGIVDANVRVQHKKLGSSGEYIAATNDYKCQEPSDETPVANRVLECRLSGTNIIQLDSGDKYTLTFTVTTGGYRDLINPDTRLFYKRQIYNGISSQNEMEYKFDYDVPVHCIEFGTCSGNDVPLKLEKDITKEHIRSFWKGWSDRNLSGIKRYALEFWKMEYSSDYDGLREPDILPDYNPTPQYITEVNDSDTIEFPIYKPSEPGVYSVILEVADRANNSRYTRRLVIYDDSSEVTINNDFRVYATSASEQSDFIWQTSPNADDVQNITLSVTWKGHFINTLHENNHFLAKVLDYTPRLSDNMKRVDYKNINPIFDDNEGERNKSAIPNVKSIIKFEVAHGTESSISPSTGWNIVSPIKDSETFDLIGVDIRSGDSRQIWVKAFDVMGNTKIDSTIVYFDSSPPQIWEPTFQPNVRNGKYHFSSRITMQAKDEHSGLKTFSFKFRVKSTNEVTHEKELDVATQPSETCRNSPSTCYCIRKGECFLLSTVVDIDNCWLKVPIEKVKDEIHEVEITVYNLAMLSSATTYTIGMVDSLNGVRDYNSPTNITIVQTTDTSLSIKWVQAPTCYERAGIMIILYKPDNTTIKFKVHKDATTFDLTGLTPTTNYRFALYTKYGNDSFFVTSGSTAALKFVTAEESRGFPPGSVAGLVVGFILLIIIIVAVLLFLGRTGRLQPAKARMTEGFRTIRNTIRFNHKEINGYNNRAYSTKFDDDIYYYGQMNTKVDNSIVIPRKQISLESELCNGKFATIYIAKYYGNLREEQTVVAKVVRDDQNEEHIMKMKAKINFYAEKVGHHKNVMDFIGYVEDDVRGPFMVLEYCEKGVLKDFLLASKDNFTVDLEERLFRMAFGISLGMDYLSSKQVVHRKLAARNVLLNALLEPKITGFGPDPSAEDGETEERLPLKWMAPECMTSTKNANELSDVFSYGIVLWEIFSLGATPYPGIQGREVSKRLKQGYKMKKPEYCDDSFYKIMLKCWHYDPTKRSGFAQIKDELTKMFQEGPGDQYYYRTNDLE